jgi:ubiquinone/menaquinone biosynthesis C-methylase UbiE
VSREVTTERVRSVYDRLSDRYDQGMSVIDRLLKVERGRSWIGARASGETLEIGIGTGLNVPHYRADVALTGVDLSAPMLAHARRRAAELGRSVALEEANAEALPFRDRRFDTVVFGLCLCSVPDDRRAVGEAARVLRPGGRLLLLEHVRSTKLPIRVLQRAMEPLSVRFQADHLVREPLDVVRDSGLEVEEIERWALGIMEAVSARKPREAA